MAEEITDLTGDENSDVKKNGKKKPTKEKAPKAPPGPVTDGDKPGEKEQAKKAGEKATSASSGDKGKAEKKKSKLLLTLLLIFIPLFLIAVCVVALILNVFDVRYMVGGLVREPLLRAVVWFDPGFSSLEGELRDESDERAEELDAREEELNTRDKELAEREEEVETGEQQLDRRTAALDRRETALNEQARELDAAIPTHQRQMTDEEIADMLSLSRTFSQMPPETAAEILTEIENLNDVATILYFMVERNAAAILASMEVELAAELTEILLDN